MPAHRRVLHIEFAPEDALPAPLSWAFAHAGGGSDEAVLAGGSA